MAEKPKDPTVVNTVNGPTEGRVATKGLPVTVTEVSRAELLDKRADILGRIEAIDRAAGTCLRSALDDVDFLLGWPPCRPIESCPIDFCGWEQGCNEETPQEHYAEHGRRELEWSRMRAEDRRVPATARTWKSGQTIPADVMQVSHVDGRVFERTDDPVVWVGASDELLAEAHLLLDGPVTEVLP